MIYPSPDRLDAMESKYALVIVAAKRARQLKEGARKLTDSKSTNPLTVALEEIAAGQIVPIQTGEPEKLPTSVPATPVMTGLLATSFDDEEPLHEPNAAEVHALLSAGEDLATFEEDAELSDEVMQTDDDVMEAEIDDAVQEGPYGVPVPGEGLGIVVDDTAQDAEDLLMDDNNNEE